MQVNLFFRKPYPSAFSIERLFEQLATQFEQLGVGVSRFVLPEYNNTLGNLRRNNEWAGTQVQGQSANDKVVNHITGDVTSLIFNLGQPTVITFHDCNPLFRYPKWHPRYWFYRWLIYELPARRAAAVTAISEKTRSELLELTNISDKNLHVIPNFVDPAIRPAPRPFDTDCPVVLQVGVKPNKNLGRLAQALRGLRCRLEIVGTPGPEDLRQLEDNQIDFSWHAGLSDEEVRRKYENCDLLAFVSTYEGFGLPILEAQVTGRPVVTSDLSPHREVAGGGGAVLVDPLNVNSIREGISRVIDDASLREKLLVNGRKNSDNYRIEAIADQYLKLYSNLF